MTFNKSILATIAFVLLLAGCTVYQQPYPQGYVEPIYDPALAAPVYVGGVQGYYVGGIFQPMIVVGGVSGYYNSSHVFVSNSVTVRDSVRTHKPFYSGPNSASTNVNVNVGGPGGARPAYGSGGTATKGAPSTVVNNTTVNNTTVNKRPDYGSGGSASKGAPSAAAPVAARPNYGSGGGASKGAPSAAARPNYGGGGSSGKSGKR